MELTATKMKAAQAPAAPANNAVSSAAQGFSDLLQAAGFGRVEAKPAALPETVRRSAVEPPRAERAELVARDADARRRHAARGDAGWIPDRAVREISPERRDRQVEAKGRAQRASDTDTETNDTTSADAGAAPASKPAATPSQTQGADAPHEPIAEDEAGIAAAEPMAPVAVVMPVPAAPADAQPSVAGAAQGAPQAVTTGSPVAAASPAPIEGEAPAPAPVQVTGQQPVDEAEFVIPQAKTALADQPHEANLQAKPGAGANVSAEVSVVAEPSPAGRGANAAALATQALLTEQSADASAAEPAEGADVSADAVQMESDPETSADGDGGQEQHASGKDGSSGGQKNGQAMAPGTFGAAVAAAAQGDRSAGNPASVARAEIGSVGAASAPGQTGGAGAVAAKPGLGGRAPATAGSAVDQVKLQLSKAVAQGKDVIKIKMHPESLGRVDVRLEVREGAVKAHIVADSRETLSLLQQDSRVLERALQDAGLRTEGNSLSFDLRDQRMARDGNAHSQDRGGPGGHRTGSGNGDENSEGAPSARGSRGIIASDRVDISV